MRSNPGYLLKSFLLKQSFIFGTSHTTRCQYPLINYLETPTGVTGAGGNNYEYMETEVKKSSSSSSLNKN